MVSTISCFRLLIGAILLSLLIASSNGIGSNVEELEVSRDRVKREAVVLGPPTRIRRAKISMVGTKVVMGDSRSNSQMLDLYQFRVGWSEPGSWNDDLDESARRYELECWVEDGSGHRKTIVKQRIGAYFSGYDEKYRFPPGMDLATQCRVRAINSASLATSWVKTNRVNVKDVPVYLPGFKGVDLRGLSPEGILAAIMSKNSTDIVAATAQQQK